jgi:uncharacterized membrane protein YcaP (DUF421 family)
MFFDSWHGLLRVLVVGVLAYAAVVVVLRISGKRTLAKMNAFDLVVTVALGSTLSSILLSKDVALFEGVLGLALLAFLQFVIAWASVHWRRAETIAKSNARILLHDGVIDTQALRDERVTREEVLAAVRSGGFGDLEAIAGVVLETDGSFSVIPRANAGSRSAFP